MIPESHLGKRVAGGGMVVSKMCSRSLVVDCTTAAGCSENEQLGKKKRGSKGDLCVARIGWMMMLKSGY